MEMEKENHQNHDALEAKNFKVDLEATSSKEELSSNQDTSSASAVDDGPADDPTKNHLPALISCLKGTRIKVDTAVPRRVSFFIHGVVLQKDDEDVERVSDDGTASAGSNDVNSKNPGNLHMGTTQQSWYFQLCINFTVEAACQSLNLQHKEILVGAMITKKYSTDIFAKSCFVYFDFPSATVRWTKKEELKANTREHKYIKVGSMSSSVPQGTTKGTAVDVELVGSDAVILYLNNGKTLELKTSGSLLLDWYRLLRRFVTHR